MIVITTCLIGFVIGEDYGKGNPISANSSLVGGEKYIVEYVGRRPVDKDVSLVLIRTVDGYFQYRCIYAPFKLVPGVYFATKDITNGKIMLRELKENENKVD